MNWWQFGLLIIGLLAAAWLFVVVVTFGMAIAGIAGHVAGAVDSRKDK